jgi:thiol-disulfide isomerase/thioredoxin
MWMLLLIITFQPPLIFPPTGIYAQPQQDQVVGKAEPISPYNLIFFTASYCSPCRQFKDSGKFDQLKVSLAKHGIRVQEVDVQANPDFHKGRIPKFWLCKEDEDGRNFRAAEWPAGDLVTSQRVLDKIKEQTKESRDVK